MSKLPESLAAASQVGWLMIISRTNGEKIELKVVSVDRPKRIVVIDIPQYNSRFTFSSRTGQIALTASGRQAIDKSWPAIRHVSKSVYAAMAKWAGSILADKRRR